MINDAGSLFKKHEEAVAVEKTYFSKTDRLINPQKNSPYKYWQGCKPVLVTAPHSVRHVRKKKIKPSDIFTGSIAYFLFELTGCHSLALVKSYNGDPNYDQNCVFKEKIKDICSDNEIKLVIDLHGASRDRPFEIDLGTMNGKSLLGNREIKKLLMECFQEYGIEKITCNNLSADNQDTVTKYTACKLKIPSLQIEINRRLRAPNQNGEPFNRLLASMALFVSQIGG